MSWAIIAVVVVVIALVCWGSWSRRRHRATGGIADPDSGPYTGHTGPARPGE